VDQRAQQLGHAVVHRVLMVHERIHAAQQVLMRHLAQEWT
ncbi:MAG: hypothetical protein RLZZ369_102, partial [Pseudomonadota bacterium]